MYTATHATFVLVWGLVTHAGWELQILYTLWNNNSQERSISSRRWCRQSLLNSCHSDHGCHRLHTREFGGTLLYTRSRKKYINVNSHIIACMMIEPGGAVIMLISPYLKCVVESRIIDVLYSCIIEVVAES